jgi:small-conductance mechanosensitive channel
METVFDIIKFNFTNIYKLFTHEDAIYYNAHKILGCICISNYLYRFYLWYHYGLMFYTPTIFNTLTIVSHILLSGSSFIFKLSSKRIRITPIIWPEGRMHSIIFAYRSLFIMLLFLLYWKTHWQIIHYLRGCVVFLTLLCADGITYYYKFKEKVLETDDSTMRKMPMPQYFSDKFTKYLNILYSTFQVLATMTCIFSNNIDKIFSIVFPIQIAMFLMTLAKKNIISSGGWHLGYTLTLFISFYLSLYSMKENVDYKKNIIYLILIILFVLLRFRYNVNKYLLWTSIILVNWVMIYNNIGFRISDKPYIMN